MKWFLPWIESSWKELILAALVLVLGYETIRMRRDLARLSENPPPQASGQRTYHSDRSDSPRETGSSPPEWRSLQLRLTGLESDMRSLTRRINSLESSLQSLDRKIRY